MLKSKRAGLVQEMISKLPDRISTLQVRKAKGLIADSENENSTELQLWNELDSLIREKQGLHQQARAAKALKFSKSTYHEVERSIDLVNKHIKENLRELWEELIL